MSVLAMCQVEICDRYVSERLQTRLEVLIASILCPGGNGGHHSSTDARNILHRVTTDIVVRIEIDHDGGGGSDEDADALVIDRHQIGVG